jgi:hypothetical protein
VLGCGVYLVDLRCAAIGLLTTNLFDAASITKELRQIIDLYFFSKGNAKGSGVRARAATICPKDDLDDVGLSVVRTFGADRGVD